MTDNKLRWSKVLRSSVDLELHESEFQTHHEQWG